MCKESLPKVQTHDQFLVDFSEHLEHTSFDSAVLFSMQFEVSPGDSSSSLVFALNALRQSRRQHPDKTTALAIDGRYADVMTRINIRDIHRFWPLPKAERQLKAETILSTRDWIDRLARDGILMRLRQRHQSPSWASPLRRIASTHLLQPWSTIHQKGGFIVATNPQDSLATLSTGNLTTSDSTLMNNLALSFQGTRGHDMAQFMKTIVTSPGKLLRTAGSHVWQESVDDWVTLIHDYGNAGDPARLPLIHVAAEKIIDPRRDERVIDGDLKTRRPTNIVAISQYELDGQLAKMLYTASTQGARVVVPRQPSGDYRRSSFPYAMQGILSPLRRESDTISRPTRARPSHIKSLIATYDDGSAAILFGSDNYLTHLQKLVRNEEMAVLLHINPNNATSLATYTSFCDTLFALGEITQETRSHLELHT